MRIVEHRALPGPNVHSRYKTIHMVLDISPYQHTPSDEMPHLEQRLLDWFPGLQEHRCSLGRRGGFVERLRRGTWLAHVTEHVAIELQCMAGIQVGFGKTRMTQDEAVYTVAYRYRTEAAGLAAGRLAVEAVEAAARPPPEAALPQPGDEAQNPPSFDVEAAVATIRRLHREDAWGPSTQAIVDEAYRRGIPVMRLNEAAHIQLGHGARRQVIQASLTGQTSCLASEIADDKLRTKEVLGEAGLPVPRGREVVDVAGALEAAHALGFPVVVKPLMGNHGRGITTGICTEGALRTAYAAAAKVYPYVLVEEHLEGGDFRVLVVGHKFVAAAQRVPASVTAQPGKTIQQLIDEANADLRRGEGHEAPLTRIRVDDETRRVLASQGLALNAVAPAGSVVRLKDTANLSSGGTAIDVTDEVHPEVRRMCERASRLIGLDVMGIDIVAPDLRAPLAGRRAGIVEVNAAPGLRMHTHPTLGRRRDVARPIMDLLFPEGDGRIPLVAVTGTNGKTTTVRLIGHILGTHGGRVGMATTDGVLIGPDVVMRGDYAGPTGAGIVLQDPWVDHAVLEVARGGIIRRGLGYDHATVAVLLNIANDHLGAGGVENLEDLAHVKAVVAENVAPDGVAVLNARDPRVMRVAERLSSRIVLFSTTPDSLRGDGVTVEQGAIVVRRRGRTQHVADTADIPLLLGGQAAFNLENVLAAVAAADALRVPLDTVRQALSTFEPTPDRLPGRMNLVERGGVTVLVDYGHNPAALRALAPVVAGLGSGRRIVSANATGNRRDGDIIEFGRSLAAMYDHFLLSDPDPRGRPPGQTRELVCQGLLQAGVAEDSIERFALERDAIARALELARPGDLVVVQADDVQAALAHVQGHPAGRTAGALRDAEAAGAKQVPGHGSAPGSQRAEAPVQDVQGPLEPRRG